MDRLDERMLEMLEQGEEVLDQFATSSLNPQVRKLLYPYQHLHLRTLMVAFKTNRNIIDGSDTGTGKTFTALGFCRQMNLRPIILAPKTALFNWRRTVELFDLSPLTITNYELIRNCKHLITTSTGTKQVDSKFISRQIDPETGNIVGYQWRIPSDGIIIFDEAHRCKNINSHTGKLLKAAKPYPTLMLSATLCDKPKDFKLFGYMLGFYKDLKQSNNWINGELVYDRRSRKKISHIHKQVYPKHGSRMIIADLGDQFPKNQVIPSCYELTDPSPIVSGYKKIIKLIKNNPVDLLKQIGKQRQMIEAEKIMVIKQLMTEYLDQNFSVAVFVNYRRSIKTLKHLLKEEGVTVSVVHGGQTAEKRESNINQFQTNRRRVIICNIRAGGESISLHDTDGGFRRVSLISPSFSSIELKQALGRIHRAGGKSPALQRIIFIAGTYEETIYHTLNRKLQFGARLTNADLTSFAPEWKGEKEEEEEKEVSKEDKVEIKTEVGVEEEPEAGVRLRVAKATRSDKKQDALFEPVVEIKKARRKKKKNAHIGFESIGDLMKQPTIGMDMEPVDTEREDSEIRRRRRRNMRKKKKNKNRPCEKGPLSLFIDTEQEFDGLETRIKPGRGMRSKSRRDRRGRIRVVMTP